MCGIFGISFKKECVLTNPEVEQIFANLFLISARRGKEASGYALKNDNNIKVFKAPIPANEVVTTEKFYKDINGFLVERNTSNTLTAIGHSRLVTDGVEIYNENNQPVIKDGIVGIHNGIIVNYKHLWEKNPDLKQQSELDSEVIFTLFNKFYSKSENLCYALNSLYNEIFGMASIGMIFDKFDNMLLATNNGSLYYTTSNDGLAIIFASEKVILEILIKEKKLEFYFDPFRISKLKPWEACLVNLLDLNITHFSFHNCSEHSSKLTFRVTTIIDDSDKKFKYESNQNITPPKFIIPSKYVKLYKENRLRINSLRRCSKCLLPETFPFIKFDPHGVCNYCHNYRKLEYFGEKQLSELVENYRKPGESPDVIVGFSGGRDSSYCLYYVKEVLKMKPLAYSYDWGMLTDLARRNQSRLCGKLGIEHILISADIKRKRNYIRKNVEAWLRKPHLGTVPLFMAGDKQYFYYANKLMKEYKIDLIFFGENLLETTFFKYGFCGVQPHFNKEKSFTLSIGGKLKLLMFYTKQYLSNPKYLNRSLLDGFGAYLSFYFIPHNYINIYKYIEWDENKIVNLLRKEFDWEISPDTPSTWRIGDGTASFYNYIYYVVAGFSEFDTFRSNQIREGIITRDEGLKMIDEENKPRFESIKWYLDTIGLDFESTLDKINMIEKYY